MNLDKEYVLERWREELRQHTAKERTMDVYIKIANELGEEATRHNRRINAWTLVYQNLFDEVFPLNRDAERRQMIEELEEEGNEVIGLTEAVDEAVSPGRPTADE